MQQNKDGQLDRKRIAEIQALSQVPLVIHGGSGVPTDQRTVLARTTHICKFNIGTELRMAFGTALRKAQDKDRRVPLGLVRSSWGGTKIRAWSSPEAIDVCRQQNPAPAGSTSMLFSNMILPLVGLEFSAVVWCEWHDS